MGELKRCAGCIHINVCRHKPHETYTQSLINTIESGCKDYLPLQISNEELKTALDDIELGANYHSVKYAVQLIRSFIAQEEKNDTQKTY